MKFLKVILIMTLSFGVISAPTVALSAETCATDAECKALIAKNKEQQEAKKKERDTYKIEAEGARAQLAEVKEDMNNVRVEMEAKEAEIATTQAGIEEKEAELEKSAVTIMEMIGRKQKESNKPQVLMLIFSAKSFSELVKTVDILTMASNSEKEVIDALEIEFNKLRQIKTELEIQKSDLDFMMEELEEMQAVKETILVEVRAKEQEAIAELETLAASAEDIQRQQDLMNQPPPTRPSKPEGGNSGGGNNSGGGSNSGGSDNDGGDTSDGGSDGGDTSGGGNTPTPSSGFSNPVRMDSTVTAHFRSPTYLSEIGSVHLGMDLWSPSRYGTPIMSIADGWVLETGYYGALGNIVAVGHNVNGTKYVSLYAHMQSINVGVGQYVYGGDVVGGMGSSGGDYAPHLHLEVAYRDYFTSSWYTRNDTNIDPLRVIPGGYYEAPDAW